MVVMVIALMMMMMMMMMMTRTMLYPCLDRSSWSLLYSDPYSDPSYWESLYTKTKDDKSQGRSKNPLMEGAPSGLLARDGPEAGLSNQAVAAILAEPVDIISFDLDDTLWPGKTIIENANRALDEYLREHHPLMVGEGKKSLGTVMTALATRYPDEFLEVKDDPTSVVRFTDLRKLALGAMAKEAGYPNPEATAEECFAVWIAARHDVEGLLFPGTIPLLRRLKEDKGLRLCAITNGNCDVMRVPVLAPLLDFCINAERVGARKRTGKPYEAAFTQAGVISAGPRWVHIGDDFSEDIAAAKAFNVRTIWFRTKEFKAAAEAKEKMKASRKPLDGGGSLDGQGGGSSSTTFVTEPPQRFFQDKDVIKVSGTSVDDYLSHFIVKEFADAEAETMQDVESVIDGWIQAHKEASNGDGSAIKSSEQQLRDGASSSAPLQERRPVANQEAPGTHKFCTACGTKLKVLARFCSSCGEPQE